MKPRGTAVLGGVALAAALAAACALAPGCTGSLLQSKAPVPAVYLLSVGPASPAAAGAAPGAVAVDLAVQRPRVRAGLDSDSIAVVYPDRRLDHFAAARWSGPLDAVLQDLAVQAFRSSGLLRNAGAETSAFGGGYRLELEVVDFQAEYTAAGAPPTVRVRLQARVGVLPERRVIGSAESQALVPAAANTLTAIVAAYQGAVDQALAGIVGDTVRMLRTASENR